jgi:hypothetical protein
MSDTVKAEPRKLRAKWTIEPMQDLVVISDFEMLAALTGEIETTPPRHDDD